MRNKPVILVLAAHPGPALVVTVVGIVLGVAVGYSPARLVLLAAVILTGQLSIGWSNDWIDARRDAAVGRTDKPVAQGLIGAATVRAAALIAAGSTVVLALTLGPFAAIAHIIAVGAGWAYNAGMKGTVLSVLPYIVSFGLLPAIATLGQVEPHGAAVWVLAVGALLGTAAHFTNVLPDLEDDRRTGVRGLPQLLGARASGLAAFACVAAAGILLALCPGLPPAPIAVAGLVVTVFIAAAGTLLVLRRHTSRLLMRLVMTGAIVDVVMLAFSGHAIVA
jgi:4-hydroxybenzoate polyprenyltransferase